MRSHSQRNVSVSLITSVVQCENLRREKLLMSTICSRYHIVMVNKSFAS